ncbi:FmdB family zinc ribbon protein [Mobilicoccus caccae]|uniref:Putative regulatory protein FmdB zinc ribbon domain-containing protein n=1 Tax=Mobilicoccus caccae TaxID=1859295 RepID=A0ABQ6ISC4_9MICO|nr:FmdB family zinc ribbon protein [Mobilicoccus caccae]GMA40805.1 hypothetical protein GCM10025883_28500 [Mobilicoccus caccae]
MPTYAYACTECDHDFETVQSFTDDALTTCPQCEGRLRKVFNSVGVVFKGSGFYRTDSRNGSDGKNGKASTNGSSSSTSSAGSNSGSTGASKDSSGSSSSSSTSSTGTSSSASSSAAAS